MRSQNEKWLSKTEWEALQLKMPIVCVDVLPFRYVADGRIEVGLIYRETPHQGLRWCLIGGRLLYNESLHAGIIRQIMHSLGPKVRCALLANTQPMCVAEYYPRKICGKLFDPRKHAIGITFMVRIDGSIQPQGEALDFSWFNLDRLQSSRRIGFGQKGLVLGCIQQLKNFEST